MRPPALFIALLALLALLPASAGKAGPVVQSAAALSSDKAALVFDRSSVGQAGLVTCSAAGLELLISSQLNASWVPATIVFQSGAAKLTVQAPDHNAGCEQTLSAVRYQARCAPLKGGGQCGTGMPPATNCSIFDAGARARTGWCSSSSQRFQ